MKLNPHVLEERLIDFGTAIGLAIRKVGDLVLLTAFGAGFHWAAMLVRL